MSDAPTSEQSRFLARAGPALAAAGLALALYAVTLGGTYVYDDLYIVHDDPRLHDPSLWGAYWTRDYFLGGVDRLYRPLVSTSYALQWQLHGERPWAFHGVNWVLHAAVSALVAELARRLSGPRVALAAGLLFAAHPLHVEAVANIVGRAELMCALGTVGALVLMARRPMTLARAAAIAGCCVLAVLSKEQGMLLPLLLLALGWVMHRRPVHPAHAVPEEPSPAEPLPAAPEPVVASGVPPAERKALLMLTVAVCWALAGYILVRETWIRFWWDRSLLDWTVNPLVLSQGLDRWLVPLALLGRYTALLVAPTRLSLDYGGLVIPSSAHAGDPYLYLGAAALALWIVLFVGAARRRAWPTVFCLLALGITYGMVANVITLIGTIFAERLMYLPSVFFVILAAQALARLPRRAGAAALVLLVVMGSLRTWTYARLWNDRLTIYAASAAAQPRSVQAHLLLSNELRKRREFDRAEEAAAAARALAPEHWEVYYYSGLNALERGDLDEAERYAGKALGLKQAMPAIGLFGMIQEARAATRPTTAPATAPTTAP
jgi:hypothetical protein